jgi:hypothetical protein
MRTPQAKLATYSHWPAEGIAPQSQAEEVELYDYSTRSGRLELENSAGHSPIEASMRSQYHSAFSEELRAPLPHRLSAAHGRGFADYFSTARNAATAATARRRQRSERDVGTIPQTSGPQGAPTTTRFRRGASPSRPPRHR